MLGGRRVSLRPPRPAALGTTAHSRPLLLLPQFCGHMLNPPRGAHATRERRDDRRLLPIELAQLASQRRVPVVLDRIVGPARKQLRNLCPPITELSVRIEQDAVLLCCPVVLLDRRVELIVPPLAALLPCPP